MVIFENIDIDIDIDKAIPKISISIWWFWKISISIRQICKISISIKYRIDSNLAYRTGLVRPPQGSWVSIQSSRGTELRWWKIERLAPARWKFHCRRLSQLTVYTWWRFIVMLQCTIFLGSPPISRDVLAGIFWRGKKFFVRIFFLQLFESEELKMTTECSKPGQNSMQSSWHSHCCWVKAKTLIWSPPTCSTGTWAQAPMAR